MEELDEDSILNPPEKPTEEDMPKKTKKKSQKKSPKKSKKSKTKSKSAKSAKDSSSVCLDDIVSVQVEDSNEEVIDKEAGGEETVPGNDHLKQEPTEAEALENTLDMEEIVQK